MDTIPIQVLLLIQNREKAGFYDVITDEDKVKSGIVHELKDKYASEEGLVENSTPEEDADVFLNVSIHHRTMVLLPGVWGQTV